MGDYGGGGVRVAALLAHAGWPREGLDPGVLKQTLDTHSSTWSLERGAGTYAQGVAERGHVGTWGTEGILEQECCAKSKNLPVSQPARLGEWGRPLSLPAGMRMCLTIKVGLKMHTDCEGSKDYKKLPRWRRCSHIAIQSNHPNIFHRPSPHARYIPWSLPQP